MQQDKLTIKSQEAVHHAKRLADHYRHGEIGVEHLLLALVEQQEGVVPPLLEKLGVARDALRSDLVRVLEAGPQVEGAATERYPSRGLRAVLDRAFGHPDGVAGLVKWAKEKIRGERG